MLALYSPNLPEYALAAYGAMAVGGAVTGANPLLTTEELAGQLADAEARLLVTVPPFLDRALAAADKAGVQEVLVFEEAEGATPFRELLTHVSPPAQVAIDPDRDLRPPLLSGTTGLAKGVELTHTQLVTNLRQAQAVLGFREDDVVLAVAPFFHAMGFNILLACSLADRHHHRHHAPLRPGGLPPEQSRSTGRPSPSWSPSSSAWPTTRLSTPTTCRRCEVLGVGAAPLGAEPEQRCAERLGCMTIQGYGMTETTALVATGHSHAPRRGSVGRLVPNTEARIVDPDSGADLGPGRTEAVGARPPRSCAATATAEATAQAVDGDGWLHTGDLCYLDEDGYLFVVDRLKELIKYKGYQVAPAELEHLLLTPAVADAAVVPRPDPEAGEVPVTHIALRGQAAAEELLTYVAERVAPCKKLRGVRFTDQVPAPRPASCCAASWWRPSAPGHASSAALPAITTNRFKNLRVEETTMLKFLMTAQLARQRRVALDSEYRNERPIPPAPAPSSRRA